MLSNFKHKYIWPICNAMTHLVRIPSGFRKLWRHTFNIEKPIYGFSCLITLWVLQIVSWYLVYMCILSLWLDVQNMVLIASGFWILWRIEKSSSQHEKSHLRISSCYIFALDRVICFKIGRIIHIPIAFRHVKCGTDMIQIVVSGSTFWGKNKTYSNHAE